ncbi:TrbI F-type domain-containing protein [Shewanella colwelliana]|uniref:TrbI F-type domain-containing protein n=1 Tax=Shewanella colwelliana TaxID=23 RepID=UPI003736CA8F
MNMPSLNAPMLILIALLISISVTLCTHMIFNQDIVEFDINDTITTFEHNIAQSQLSDEKRLSEIKRFTQTLEDTVAQYAQDNNVIVLVSPAIVSGAKDVTKDIQRQLVDNLKAQNDRKHLNTESDRQ